MAKEPVVLLIDSDIVAYKFASANQKNFDWESDGDTSSYVAPLEEVMEEVDAYLIDLHETLKADRSILCLTDKENWRKGVLPTYKDNRKEVIKPELLSQIKQLFRDKYDCYERPTLEADDIMGILSTHPTLIPGKKIIVSEDKDMKTIPGWLFNPAKDTKPRYISPEEAEYWHIYQTLCGDTADGYKGCPGVGKVLADRFIKERLKVVPYEHIFKSGPRKGQAETRWREDPSESLWATVVSLFHKEGLTEEDALVQARVACICHSKHYDFKNKEVILWSPSRNS